MGYSVPVSQPPMGYPQPAQPAQPAVAEESAQPAVDAEAPAQPTTTTENQVEL